VVLLWGGAFSYGRGTHCDCPRLAGYEARITSGNCVSARECTCQVSCGITSTRVGAGGVTGVPREGGRAHSMLCTKGDRGANAISGKAGPAGAFRTRRALPTQTKVESGQRLKAKENLRYSKFRMDLNARRSLHLRCGGGDATEATQGPSWGCFKNQFATELSTFDNNSPQNGSKNEETAPKARTGCPHEGPSVVPATHATTR
jgi:hypothetical protein